jgi:hypothetical protein
VSPDESENGFPIEMFLPHSVWAFLVWHRLRAVLHKKAAVFAKLGSFADTLPGHRQQPRTNYRKKDPKRDGSEYSTE